MSIFVLHTNVARGLISTKLLQELTEIIAKTYTQPLQNVTVRIVPEQCMATGGTADPCGEGYMSYIGNTSTSTPSVDHNLTESLLPFVKKNLHIDPNRFMLLFNKLSPQQFSHDGRAFDKLETKL